MMVGKCNKIVQYYSATMTGYVCYAKINAMSWDQFHKEKLLFDESSMFIVGQQ